MLIISLWNDVAWAVDTWNSSCLIEFGKNVCASFGFIKLRVLPVSIRNLALISGIIMNGSSGE